MFGGGLLLLARWFSSVDYADSFRCCLVDGLLFDALCIAV